MKDIRKEWREKLDNIKSAYEKKIKRETAIEAKRNHMRLCAITERLSIYNDVTIEKLSWKARWRDIVYKRHIFNYLVYTNTTFTYQEIGALINRDHSTVMHSVDVVKDWIREKSINLNQFKDVLDYDYLDKTYK